MNLKSSFDYCLINNLIDFFGFLSIHIFRLSSSWKTKIHAFLLRTPIMGWFTK